jgi:serine/threonine protein kinase
MKNQHLITLIPDADKLQKWLEALRPYVIQTAIEEKYSLLKMLGEGTYGKVCLAEELPATKKLKKQPSFSNEDM